MAERDIQGERERVLWTLHESTTLGCCVGDEVKDNNSTVCFKLD